MPWRICSQTQAVDQHLAWLQHKFKQTKAPPSAKGTQRSWLVGVLFLGKGVGLLLKSLTESSCLLNGGKIMLRGLGNQPCCCLLLLQTPVKVLLIRAQTEGPGMTGRLTRVTYSLEEFGWTSNADSSFVWLPSKAKRKRCSLAGALNGSKTQVPACAKGAFQIVCVTKKLVVSSSPPFNPIQRTKSTIVRVSSSGGHLFGVFFPEPSNNPQPRDRVLGFLR